MDQSSWNHGSVGSSPSRALGQQTEMGSGLWYGLADSWLAPMCAFDPLNQAKGSSMAMQLFAVSPDPDETEAVPSDTDRTPDVQLHFSADCRMRNNII